MIEILHTHVAPVLRPFVVVGMSYEIVGASSLDAARKEEPLCKYHVDGVVRFTDGKTKELYLPTSIQISDGKGETRTVKKKEKKLGEGGLGSVFEYAEDATGYAVALKVTVVDIDSDLRPDESHHLTEATGPSRLSGSSCARFFVDTFVPTSSGVNAWVVYGEDNEDSMEAHTIGTQNPLDLFDVVSSRPDKRWYRGKDAEYESSMKEYETKVAGVDKDLLEILAKTRFKVFLFTVMRKASGSLVDYVMGYDIATKVLDFVTNAQKCLESEGYYYKDVKLDQILTFLSSTGGELDLRLGDLGNLCHSTKNQCEFGYFDDPLSYVYAAVSHGIWRWNQREEPPDGARSRGLKWQTCMFTCELACAILQGKTKTREEYTVYELPPHTWNDLKKTPGDIERWIDKLIGIVNETLGDYEDCGARGFQEYAKTALIVLRDVRSKMTPRV